MENQIWKFLFEMIDPVWQLATGSGPGLGSLWNSISVSLDTGLIILTWFMFQFLGA